MKKDDYREKFGKLFMALNLTYPGYLVNYTEDELNRLLTKLQNVTKVVRKEVVSRKKKSEKEEWKPCPECGGKLEIAGHVPAGDLVFKCTACGKTIMPPEERKE